MQDYLQAIPGFGFARVRLPRHMEGKRLRDIDLPHAYGVTVLAVCREDSVTLMPPSSEVLLPGDELIVAGPDSALERVPGAAD
jgi:trk system potassium uptake protein TrkA